MTDDLGQRTVPASALRELVAEWRERAGAAPSSLLDSENKARIEQIESCADELEELING